jgi:hypothetical protein
MIYAFIAWQLAADTYLTKLQRLQNTVHRAIVNSSRRSLIHELLVAFDISCVMQAGSKRTSYETTKMHILATLVQAKTHTKSIRHFNLAVGLNNCAGV